jgi:hypothetical protein
MRTLWTGGLLALFGLLSTSLARSQPDQDHAGQRQEAKETFDRATQLFEAGQPAQAAELYRRAHELEPHPAVLANIALSYDRAGDRVEAVRYYRRYLAAPVRSADKAAARARLDELSQLVGELQVQCQLEDCQVFVDGTLHVSAPGSIIVEPGQHRVEAYQAQVQRASTTALVQAGQVLAVDLFPVPGEPSITEVAEPAPTRAGPGFVDLGFWFAGGLTALALPAAALFGALSLVEQDAYQRSGGDDAGAEERGERSGIVAGVALGAAALGAVAMVTTAVVDLAGEEQDASSSSLSQTPRPAR